MLNFTKTAAAVLALSSSAVFAGTMGPVCAPGPVTVPCEFVGWDFGGRALYLHPAGNEFGGYTTSTVGSTTTSRFDNFDYDWGWGFMIEASYHFSTGNDINVNWYRYEKSSDFARNSFTNPFSVLPIVPDTIDFFGDIKPKWDAVNFEFGQRVNFGEHKVIRFHGGAQWASLRRDLDANFRATPVTAGPATFPFSVDANVKFNGFGPRVGADMAYHFGNGFSVYANGATALLVGNNKFNVAVANSATTPTSFAFASGKKDSAVVDLEGKLGAMYDYAMGNGDLTLDVGYMVVDYLNALQFGAPSQDFNLNGLYFGAKWVGNVA